MTQLTTSSRRILCLAACLAIAVCVGTGTRANAAASPLLGHAGRWLTDAKGRVVIVHGFNLFAGGPGAHVAGDPLTAFGFDRDDARFLASEGFNAMRIALAYRYVEPRPGVYDDRFIQKFVHILRMLARYHIYTLLDYQQADYGPRTYGDGLPAWATLTDGSPNPNLGFSGGYVGDPAMERAFDNLYANARGPGGVGIADRLAAGEAHVARRFARERYLLGYDIFNEPWPGSQYPTCSSSAGCPLFDQQSMTPFERKLIAGVRRTDRKHLAFYEPNLEFNFGAQTHVGAMNDRRAGFAFHDYCLGNSSALGFPAQPPPDTTGTGCGIDEQMTMDNALAHGRASGDALLMGEWGATTVLADYQRGADEADANMLPWMNWTFYNCCETGNTPYDQGVIIDPRKEPTKANLHEGRLDVLARPYPRAIAGTPISWHWKPATRTFTFEYSTHAAARRLGRGALTDVWVGRRHYPAGYRVRVSGARVVSKANANLLELANNRYATRVRVTVAPRTRTPSRH